MTLAMGSRRNELVPGVCAGAAVAAILTPQRHEEPCTQRQ